MRELRWRLFKDLGGDVRFSLIGTEGEIIMQSEGYDSRSDARAAIKRIDIARNRLLEIDDQTPKL